MKLQKGKGAAFMFTTGAVNYGKILTSGKYKLELVIPLTLIGKSFPITIYRSDKKPFFKNIYLISLIWLPFLIASYLFVIVALAFYLLIHFFFEESESDFTDKISKWIKMILSIVGVIAIINYIF